VMLRLAGEVADPGCIAKRFKAASEYGATLPDRACHAHGKLGRRLASNGGRRGRRSVFRVGVELLERLPHTVQLRGLRQPLIHGGQRS